MFPSGSFAVTLQCSHQCDHSVPGTENLKRTKAMYQKCSKSVHLQCPGSVPAVYCFWESLGTFWVLCKHISTVPSFAVFLAGACSVPRIFPNFPKRGTLQEHSQDTAKSLLMSHSGTSLVLSLANLKVYPQFT